MASRFVGVYFNVALAFAANEQIEGRTVGVRRAVARVAGSSSNGHSCRPSSEWSSSHRAPPRRVRAAAGILGGLAWAVASSWWSPYWRSRTRPDRRPQAVLAPAAHDVRDGRPGGPAIRCPVRGVDPAGPGRRRRRRGRRCPAWRGSGASPSRSHRILRRLDVSRLPGCTCARCCTATPPGSRCRSSAWTCPAPSPADRRPGSGDRRGGYRLTTGQVTVRMIPSMSWIRPTTMRPSSSMVSAPARTMTS